MSGPNVNWAQKLYSGQMVLGTTLVTCVPKAIQQSRSQGASVLRFCDGGGAVQKPYIASDLPELYERYEWSWSDQAVEEAAWKVLEELKDKGAPFRFIPYKPITEYFILPANASGLTRRLHRQWAKTIYATFDETTYPNEVKLNGTALTYSASAPGAGEYSLSGRTLTLGDAVSASDELVARYYPAFYVSARFDGEARSGFNAITRAVALTELGG